MNKFIITQNSNNIENITFPILQQLCWDIAGFMPPPELGETDLAYMSGHISVDHSYRIWVENLAGTIGEGTSGVVTSVYLNPQGRFLDLRIDVTNGYYIQFADSWFRRTCALNWGDSDTETITESQAAAVTSLAGKFKNNASITIAELQYFTSLTTINSEEFLMCSDLTSVTFPSSVKTLGSYWQSGTKLTYLTNVENITKLDSNCFNSLNDGVEQKFEVIFNFKNVIDVGYSIFASCNIKEVYLPKLQTTFSSCIFRNYWTAWPQFAGGRNHKFTCGLFYLRDITKIYCAGFANMVCTALVINNITPPEWANHQDKEDSEDLAYEESKENMFDNSTFGGGNSKGTYIVYVPDSAITTYQNHAYWGTFCSIHGISEINNGIIYDTYNDWVEANKPIALIREYM